MERIRFNSNSQQKQLMQHKKELGIDEIKLRRLNVVFLVSSVALIKITPTIDMEKKISQQIHLVSFANRAPAEIFRTFLSQAMTPYLKSFLRQQKERFFDRIIFAFRNSI